MSVENVDPLVIRRALQNGKEFTIKGKKDSFSRFVGIGAQTQPAVPCNDDSLVSGQRAGWIFWLEAIGDFNTGDLTPNRNVVGHNSSSPPHADWRVEPYPLTIAAERADGVLLSLAHGTNDWPILQRNPS